MTGNSKHFVACGYPISIREKTGNIYLRIYLPENFLEIGGSADHARLLGNN